MDFLDDANDARLKPRLLMAMVRERLPDEKRALGDAYRLSSVLSLVRLHGLLSESHSNDNPGKDHKKLAVAWKAAVDAWTERCVSLCTDKMPDKCWVGVSFLGLTCELCADSRFLESYPAWFQALLSNLQPLADSDLVKSASCASLSDLFRRLSRFPHVKKDATSLAGKVVLPVLQLMSQTNTDAVLVAAVDLFGVLVTFFPFSLHRHYEKAEAIVISILFNNKCSEDVSKKLVYSLASLPCVKGDEECWNTIMLKVLISINMYLNQAFKGLEEDHRSSETMLLLVPPGKDPPCLLGGQSLSSSFDLKMASDIQDVLIPRLSILMQSCCALITYPPFQVNLPLRSLILLVDRVMEVDGSLRQSGSIFTSELHQEVLCAELPTLQLYSLDLLMAIVQFTGSPLLVYASHIKRILTKYLKRNPLSCLRVKVYSIIQVLLIKMGVGMALQLGENVIGSAFNDLSNLLHQKKPKLPDLNQATPVAQSMFPTKNKKRKQRPNAKKSGNEDTTESRQDLLNVTPTARLSVQISALETLEALLIVAGSVGAESWRRDVDKLLITVATSACSVVQANDRKRSSVEWEPPYTWTAFKLSALRALLASLLSYSHIRPPYLSQGLELFYRGQNDAEKEVAELCARAVLALEVLIHPRSLPLIAKISDFDQLAVDFTQKSSSIVDFGETPLANDDFTLVSDDFQPNMEVDSVALATGDEAEAVETAQKTSGVDFSVPNQVNDQENVKLGPHLDGQMGPSLPRGPSIVGPSFDVSSPSLDSLPDIVDADPDSD
ncbi:proline-, glutamic acid/leucine-rich protein [Wolffia australiana]